MLKLNVTNGLKIKVCGFLFPTASNPAKERVDAFIKEKISPLLDIPLDQIEKQGPFIKNVDEVKGITHTSIYRELEKKSNKYKNLSALTFIPLVCTLLPVGVKLVPITISLVTLPLTHVVATAVAVYILVVGLEIIIYRYFTIRENQYNEAKQNFNTRTVGMVEQLSQKQRDIVEFNKFIPSRERPEIKMSISSSAGEETGSNGWQLIGEALPSDDWQFIGEEMPALQRLLKGEEVADGEWITLATPHFTGEEIA